MRRIDLRSSTAKCLAVAIAVLVGLSTAAVAGAIPLSRHHTDAVAAEIAQRTGSARAAADASAGTPVLGAAASAASSVKASASAGAASSTAKSGSISAGATAGNADATASSTTARGASVAAEAGRAKVTATLPPCVSALLGAAGSGSVPSLSSVLSCAQTVLATMPLPAGVRQCISSGLGSLGALAGSAAAAGAPAGGAGQLSGCPVDVSTCFKAVFSSVTGLASGGPSAIPGLITAVDTCVSSIVHAVLSYLGSVPGLNTGALAALPGQISACLTSGLGAVGTGAPGDVGRALGTVASCVRTAVQSAVSSMGTLPSVNAGAAISGHAAIGG